MDRLRDLERLYELVDECVRRSGGRRCLAECTGGMGWPRRGVYFFFEAGEVRRETGSGPRIVRVGTHALKAASQTTLWSRLSQHRGARSTGTGNHRGSIFRLLVGQALIQRDGVTCPTWGTGSSAPSAVRMKERPLEQAVSLHLGQLEVAWLEVDDEAGPGSLRGLIERNAIALLSNCRRLPFDPPSDAWLGLSCPRPLVAGSGLWNQNHVTEDYDPVFLARFTSLLEGGPAAP